MMVILMKFFKQILSRAVWQSVGGCLKKCSLCCIGGSAAATRQMQSQSFATVLFFPSPSDVGVTTSPNLFLFFRDRVHYADILRISVVCAFDPNAIRLKCMTQSSFDTECSKATGYDSAGVMTILSNAVRACEWRCAIFSLRMRIKISHWNRMIWNSLCGCCTYEMQSIINYDAPIISSRALMESVFQLRTSHP